MFTAMGIKEVKESNLQDKKWEKAYINVFSTTLLPLGKAELKTWSKPSCLSVPTVPNVRLHSCPRVLRDTPDSLYIDMTSLSEFH